MHEPHQHLDSELLVELALGDLDVRASADLIGHLDRCGICRTRYEELALSIEAVLTAAPQVAPPPGFTQAALSAIESESWGAGALVEGRTRPRPEVEHGTSAGSGKAPTVVAEGAPAGANQAGRRRPVGSRWVAALAAVIALLVGSLVTLAVLGWPTAEPGGGPGAPLVTAGGELVGAVQEARYEGEAVLVTTVTSGTPGNTYDCRVALADGTVQTLSTWTLPEDGAATWVVDAPPGDIARMDLVRVQSGRTWASASL